jgi:hypothetical protein
MFQIRLRLLPVLSTFLAEGRGFHLRLDLHTVCDLAGTLQNATKRYTGGPSSVRGKTGGERPQKKDSKFGPFLTSRAAGS